MGVRAYHRFTDRPEQSVRFSDGGRGRATDIKICTYYLAGRCNRTPCRFVHDDSQKRLPQSWPKKVSNHGRPNNVWVASKDKNSNDQSTKNHYRNKGLKNSSASSRGRGGQGDEVTPQKNSTKICENWVSGKCLKEDNCQSLHSWFCGDGINMLAKLCGHKKAMSGIALPTGSDKLYSGGKDGIAWIWDCHTGQCATEIDVGDEIGSLICEGPWVFVGMPNLVKVGLKLSTFSLLFFLLFEFAPGAFAICRPGTLSHLLNINCGPGGQAHCMVVANETLFVGTEDGVILTWKGNTEGNIIFQPVGMLKGHTSAVTSLIFGAGRLYSGSMDNTIRVWDIDTTESTRTLDGHTDVVTSLLCWDQYLLSSSLDCTTKVWFATEEGKLEVAYTHKEEDGVLALSGMIDPDGKPVLLCACNDNSVHLYDLPSFEERRRIFSKSKVRAIHIGPDGLFFTGDGSGMLNMWKMF